MVKHIYVLLGVLVVAYLGFLFWQNFSSEPLSASSFEECAAQGNGVMESYPRQCRDAAGNLFIEEIGNAPIVLEEALYANVSENDIEVDVDPGSLVASPLYIAGEAKGTWFFEASFPVLIIDEDGAIVAKGFATAEDDWMTESLVPFTAMVEFTNPTLRERGSLILMRDNPSGLPEQNASLEVPVLFR